MERDRRSELGETNAVKESVLGTVRKGLVKREEAMMGIGNGKENDEILVLSGLVVVVIAVEFTKVELVGGKGKM